MNVLLITKRKCGCGGGRYTITHQHPKLTNTEEGHVIRLGTFGGLNFISADFPIYNADEAHVAIRGSRGDMNLQSLHPSGRSASARFEQAILEFNRAHSNNSDKSDIQLEDIMKVVD